MIIKALSVLDTSRLISFGKVLAVVSFIVGSVIFWFFYDTNSLAFAFAGLFFAFIAGILNLSILGSLLYRAYSDKENRERMIKTALLMLANVPVLVFYFWFAIALMNTMRITFINGTNTVLNNISIEGCEQNKINTLRPGEKKTVWVRITGDCSIDVRYKINNEIKTEEVAGYVTNSNGQKMTFKIGVGQRAL